MASKVLKQIARHLANNHIALSVPNDQYYAARSMLLREGKQYERPARVVVVVGAGASRAAAKMPDAKTAADDLASKLGVNSDHLEFELTRLSTQYRLHREDFETKLLALSKFHPQKLLTELSHLFNHRHCPSEVYEILAHLLKHRFVDAIINFNFDELLDQAVDDELGPQNYYKVISDGDCPDDVNRMMEGDRRFRRPLYIKPHGTASHKSTMRFTREAYFLLPEDIARLLRHLLSGFPTKLVLVGFGMQSVEFNSILEESLATGSEIFSFDLGELKLTEELQPLHNGRRIPLSNDYALDQGLRDLWATICKFFNSALMPRDVQRHHLIASTFGGTISQNEFGSESTNDLRSYLKDRIYVELALAVAKAKGFVHLSQISNGRVGRYVDLYKSESRDTDLTILRCCEELGLHRMGYSSETLRLEPLRPLQSVETLIIDRATFKKKSTPRMFERLRDLLSNDRQERFTKASLCKVLMDMYDGEEVEVDSPRQTVHGQFIPRAVPLSTLTAVKVYTRELLGTQWDTLLCVAESGQWLLGRDVRRVIRRQKHRCVALIVADASYNEELRSAFGQQLLEVWVLPWWLHNQHITVCLGDRHALGGLFFERRLRSSSINPVGLKEEECSMLLDVFFAYRAKAKQYKESSAIGFIPKETVDQDRTDFFQRVDEVVRKNGRTRAQNK